jgi:hypothetical protein
MSNNLPTDKQTLQSGTKKLLVLSAPPQRPVDMTEQELDAFADTLFAGLHTQVQEQQAVHS